MNIEVCFSPVLYPYYAGDEDKIVVVVDIFRASTTMCSAFANGASSIIPVASIEEAMGYKEKGYLVGAERNVKRCDFADFGNSPFDYSIAKVKGEELVFTTTNGTQAINVAKDCYALIIGAFSNLTAVATYCVQQQKDVIVLCAGWNNKFNIEDSLYGGALVAMLANKGFEPVSDAAQVALSMWQHAQSDIVRYVNKSEHIERLEMNGLLKDAAYCLQIDTVSLVPIYNKETGQLSVL